MQKNKQLLNAGRILAQRFLDFVNVSRSPFHVVNWCRNQLTKKGYEQLSQTSNWTLKKGAKYFFTRNNSTLIAFNIGQNFQPSNTGFKIVGAHTDSPCLRLAPVSKAKFKTIKQLHVSTYAGGLWHTWFDRDLVLAGRIVYKNQGKYTSTLWESKKPILKIPNLAIHLRGAERNKLDPNNETQLRPILSSTIHEEIARESLKQEAKIFAKHDEALIDLICTDTGIKPEDIVDMDLCFADSQLSDFVGLNQDFISSPRLDNLFSSFFSLMALTDIENKGSFINIAALFDHQECGSQSAQGAGSNIIMQSLRRIYDLLCEKQSGDNFYKTMQRSFLISADMAHGIHPNYSDKHQVNHQVQINKGVVIKTNVNQRYITDLISASILRIIAEKADVPIQDFIVRNDNPCGGTIGPILSSGTGMKAIDIGIPMLGMHSIRQTCGVIDTVYYHELFKAFYTHYESINHDLLDH